MRELRNELGLSQTKFGEKLGVSKSVIVNIELERVEVKDMMINLICKTFNVNPLWLSDGEGKMFVETPQSLIEDLTTEFNLTETEKKIVSNFVNLSAEDRQKIIELIKKLIT
ncbi:MAG: helix-turn-helix domain-containing protein [Ruminococcus sp.]